LTPRCDSARAAFESRPEFDSPFKPTKPTRSRTDMETRVTKLLGIEHPIVQGGMTARHSVNHQEFTW
jgi:hypothetical protein